VLFKCTWPGCGREYSTCPTVEKHVRLDHLGYINVFVMLQVNVTAYKNGQLLLSVNYSCCINIVEVYDDFHAICSVLHYHT